MGQVQYRLYIDDKPAGRELLDQVEEITVTQPVDQAWEARLQVPICTDEKGAWGGAAKPFKEPFTRVRVEVDAGDGNFTALIDGPVVGIDQSMSSEPGQSVHTVVVQDDSVTLNRQDSLQVYISKLDHEIASAIYGKAERIKSIDIDKTSKPGVDSFPWAEVYLGTEMQLLRKLAARQDKHAYVLPGKKPGESVGAFKPFPKEPDGLPPLVLLGKDRNIDSFTAKEDSLLPARVSSQSLSISDRAVARAEFSSRDADLLGEVAAGAAIKEEAKRILVPKDPKTDPATLVKAFADKSGYAIQASGSISTDCYRTALTPYRVVTVEGVNGKFNGNYDITNVTHRLTRSVYSQSFGLLRNATSAGGSGSKPPTRIS
jgi:hypothetical protein